MQQDTWTILTREQEYYSTPANLTLSSVETRTLEVEMILPAGTVE
jgi:hypothetical protein